MNELRFDIGGSKYSLIGAKWYTNDGILITNKETKRYLFSHALEKNRVPVGADDSIGGGGISSIVTDGTTIVGDGTLGNPLRADFSSVTGQRFSHAVVGHVLNGNTVNDVDFLCDGTNDTEMIKAAINSVGYKCEVLILGFDWLEPNYCYRITETIDTGYRTIKGIGSNVALKKEGNFSGNMFVNLGSILDNLVITDYSNSSDLTILMGLTSLILNCTINTESNGNRAVAIRTGTNSIIKNCNLVVTTTNGSAVGILIEEPNSSFPVLKNIFIQECNIYVSTNGIPTGTSSCIVNPTEISRANTIIENCKITLEGVDHATTGKYAIRIRSTYDGYELHIKLINNIIHVTGNVNTVGFMKNSAVCDVLISGNTFIMDGTIQAATNAPIATGWGNKLIITGNIFKSTRLGLTPFKNPCLQIIWTYGGDAGGIFANNNYYEMTMGGTLYEISNGAGTLVSRTNFEDLINHGGIMSINNIK